MSVTCRFIEENGTKAWLRVYWGSTECGGSYHNAMTPLAESDLLEAWDLGGKPEDYPDDRWPSSCEKCGASVPAVDIHRQVFHQRRYNTPSGSPEPGDMFWVTWRHYRFPNGGTTSCDWDNCDGKHLQVILPNGYGWDVDGRASNCTMLDDRNHRCWTRHGEPPNVTVDKNGRTCAAGAGSIAVTGYHGFLQGGRLT